MAPTPFFYHDINHRCHDVNSTHFETLSTIQFSLISVRILNISFLLKQIFTQVEFLFS